MNYIQGLILGNNIEVKSKLKKLLVSLGIENEMLNFLNFELNGRHSLLKIRTFNKNKDREVIVWLTNFHVMHSSLNTYITEDNKTTIKNEAYPLDNVMYIKAMEKMFPDYRDSLKTYIEKDNCK